VLQELSLHRYVCVLIGTENAYHANTRSTGSREEVALQIQEVGPIDSRGGPHHVCGVALCSMWHFALRVDTGGSPQIQEVAPTDSRGGPHYVCGVALCSVWHFTLCGEWIIEVASTDSRGGPHHVYGVALFSVWHLVPFKIRRTLARLRDTSSSSRHQACSARHQSDCAINKSNNVGDKSTGDTGAQEYRGSGV